MAVQNITYANKSYINQNSEIADTNKVNDSDMNEIKSVVNNNATELSNIIGVELFKNTSGTSSGNVNFSDAITNYDYIEVFGYTSDNVCLYVKVPQYLYTKKIGLSSLICDGSGTMYVKIGYLNIDTTNNRLSFNYAREWYKPYNSGNGGFNSSGNYIYITEVRGYKVS